MVLTVWEEILNLSNNKIVNVAYPTSDHDVVNKAYADFVARPVITIWAQENGPLNRGEYEWSFGSGDLYTLAKCGYCMPAPRYGYFVVAFPRPMIVITLMIYVLLLLE